MISDISFSILAYSVAAGSKRLPVSKFGVVENKNAGLSRVENLLIAGEWFYGWQDKWQIREKKVNFTCNLNDING